MRTLKRVFVYTVINGGMMAAAYFGFIEGIVWCSNIATFAIPTVAIISCVSSFGLWILLRLINTGQYSYDDAKEMRDRHIQSPIPRWFDLLYDVVLFVGLVILGYLWLAAFALITLTLSVYCRVAIDKIVEGVDKILERVPPHQNVYHDSTDTDEQLSRLGVFTFRDDEDQSVWDTGEDG